MNTVYPPSSSPSLRRRRLLGGLASLLACLSLGILSLSASAQSLDVKKPAPLQPGENSGTVDNFTGNNFFYFYGGPGQVTVTANYKSMSLMGTPMRSSLTVWVTGIDNGHKTWEHNMVLASLQNAAQLPLTVTLKKSAKIIVSVCPPIGGLIRTGGDYTITATGAGVRFDKPLSDSEMIVGTYTPQTDFGEGDAVKFLPDGTLLFAGGTTGTWKLFDADTHLFTVLFGNQRLSLKLMPGRGLLDAKDSTSIVFKRTR